MASLNLTFHYTYKRTTQVMVRLWLREMCQTSTSKSTQPKATTHDLIGPPDPISNLRPIVFHSPRNEHPIEKELRIRRQKVQKWNEAFWTKHNQSFVKERKKFIAANLPQIKSSEMEKQTLTADEMSVFYKTFLDKNWKVHLQYNIEWYQKNIGLVLFALRVKMFKLRQSFISNVR